MGPPTLALVIAATFCTYVELHCDVGKFLASDYPWLYSSLKGLRLKVTVDVDTARFELFLVERLSRKLR